MERLQKHLEKISVVAWGQKHFYIPETSEPIVLRPHQKAVLRYVLRRNSQGRFPFSTVIWSQPKKSGKTAIAGMVARWAAETWGRFGEILCVGNDGEQARERAYAALQQSVQLTPDFHAGHQELPGQWRLLTKESACLATGSRVKAIATDYQGEAGSNPSLIVWTELWGFINKAALRFWAEMTPSPIRLNSICWVESYAGFEGESELLYQLYDSTVLNGRQLTAGDLLEYDSEALAAFAEAPNPSDPVPCWINEPAGTFAYWDSGDEARRMPWQQGEDGARYYAAEAARQTETQMLRLHKNWWQSAESAFVPLELWDNLVNPLPLQPGDKTPLVVALDAAVTGDCFGLVAVSRNPDNQEEIAVRAVRKWTPPKGGAIDYSGPEEAVKELCSLWNVVQVAYDPYQLHDMATRLTKAGVSWFREFGQGQERLIADKGLYDLIMHARIRHDGNPDLREHITNCNAKHSKDEDTKLRLVKKSESRKIDLAVCLSMSAAECLRLNL